MTTKNTMPLIIYGAITQMMQDQSLYMMYSVPGMGSWTENGKKALQQFLLDITPVIEREMLNELDERAKKIVMKNLKGESN